MHSMPISTFSAPKSSGAYITPTDDCLRWHDLPDFAHRYFRETEKETETKTEAKTETE